MDKNGKCLYEACKLIKRAKNAVFVVVKYANFYRERRNLLRKSKVLKSHVIKYHEMDKSKSENIETTF